MKRTIIAGLLLVCTANMAAADHVSVVWYDTIRTHGQKRPDDVGTANVERCNLQFGDVRSMTIPKAYRKCMTDRGYRLLSIRLIRDPREASEPAPSYPPAPSSTTDFPPSEPPPLFQTSRVPQMSAPWPQANNSSFVPPRHPTVVNGMSGHGSCGHVEAAHHVHRSTRRCWREKD
jgi:hypothetical protein